MAMTLCSVQQCLTGKRDSERVGTALRTWHAPIFDSTFRTQTCAKEDQMVQVDHCVTLWHQRRICASHRHASSGVLEGFCIVGAEELK